MTTQTPIFKGFLNAYPLANLMANGPTELVSWALLMNCRRWVAWVDQSESPDPRPCLGPLREMAERGVKEAETPIFIGFYA
jgi:hypothetical protein